MKKGCTPLENSAVKKIPSIKGGVNLLTGFTLIEYLVYLAIFVILSSVSISLIIQFITTSRQAAAIKELQDSARNVLDVITQEVRQAKGIYTPTSVFGSHPGQLSLETENFLQDADAATFVDFYVDGGSLYQKREGQLPTRLTSASVRVENFTLTSLSQASIAAVRMRLTLLSPSFVNASSTFTSTVSLRPQS